jgi:uncharacterized membrane protein
MPPSGQQPPTPPPPPSATFVHERWQWGLEPRPTILYINLAAMLVLATWTGLMYVTPYMVEEGSLTGLDGMVGPKDHEDIWEDLPSIVSTMYSAGDAQCHQKQNRTVILNGNQMPFCARDVAIYTFMTIGIALSVFPRMPYYDRINNLKAWWLIVALVPIGIDGVGQLLGYWESTNLMRFITGGLCGFIVGIALGFMLREMGGMVREFRTERRMYKVAEDAGMISQQKKER